MSASLIKRLTFNSPIPGSEINRSLFVVLRSIRTSLPAIETVSCVLLTLPLAYGLTEESANSPTEGITTFTPSLTCCARLIASEFAESVSHPAAVTAS